MTFETIATESLFSVSGGQAATQCLPDQVPTQPQVQTQAQPPVLPQAPTPQRLDTSNWPMCPEDNMCGYGQ